MKKYTIEQILSYKEQFMGLPDIDKKFLARGGGRRNKKVLHSIDNPWLTSKEMRKKGVKKDDNGKGELMSLLNKLSKKNFSTLVKNIASLNITNCKTLLDFADVLYHKCLMEKEFIKLYVVLMKKMIKLWPMYEDEDGENIVFIKKVIQNCHKKYTESLTSDGNDKMVEINNLVLIGELYCAEIISDKIINECMDGLYQVASDTTIELLCELIFVVGKKYKNVNLYIKKLQKLSGISSKNKFCVMDIIDLKNNNWVIYGNKFEQAQKGGREMEKKKEKCKSNLKMLLDEYIDVLDVVEVEECYNENVYLEKDKIFCEQFFDVYMESKKDDKKYLAELVQHMVKQKCIKKRVLLEIFGDNMEDKKIDYPNIENEIKFLCECIL